LGKEHQKKLNMMESNAFLGTDGKKMRHTLIIFKMNRTKPDATNAPGFLLFIGVPDEDAAEKTMSKYKNGVCILNVLLYQKRAIRTRRLPYTWSGVCSYWCVRSLVLFLEIKKCLLPWRSTPEQQAFFDASHYHQV